MSGRGAGRGEAGAPGGGQGRGGSRRAWLVAGCAAVAGLGALAAPGCRVRARPLERPRLAVLIVVDALRADLLDRYDPVFRHGFRRLRDRGLRFSRAMVDHAVTVSHPGHVTLATGLVPARHGIVDAVFYERGDHGRVHTDALRDPGERILGVAGYPGVSPRRLLASALPEWFASADREARFVAIGSGQFSSLLHAGRLRGDVYWYMAPAGRFVTSSYFRKDYPDWVERFNTARLPGFMDEARAWYNEAPAAARALALPDDAPHEAYGRMATFPHLFEQQVPADRRRDPMAGARWLAGTPHLDAATLALAREAVAARALGRRGPTDYLSIVLSQTDAISHLYGPESQEMLDTLLRIDRELLVLFEFLDRTVGEERWVVALSADHGVIDLPEHRGRRGRPGRRVSEPEVRLLLDRVVRELDRLPASAGERERARRVAALLERADFVADAMTPDDLAGAGGADPFLALYRNSCRPDRVPRFPLFYFQTMESPAGRAGVAVRLAEGAIVDLDPSVHGSPYDYDRHVPLIVMGAGVQPGVSDAPARTVDVAPTLAALAGIPFPADLDGRPLAGAVPAGAVAAAAPPR